MRLRMLMMFARSGWLELTAADVDRLIAASMLSDEDLVYAAWARCECGSGLAHVRGARFWTCSHVLLAGVDAIAHEAILPFDEYAIPAEGDPHCPAETTRPRRAA